MVDSRQAPRENDLFYFSLMIHSDRDSSECRAGGLTRGCRHIPTHRFLRNRSFPPVRLWPLAPGLPPNSLHEHERGLALGPATLGRGPPESESERRGRVPGKRTPSSAPHHRSLSLLHAEGRLPRGRRRTRAAAECLRRPRRGCGARGGSRSSHLEQAYPPTPVGPIHPQLGPPGQPLRAAPFSELTLR